MKEIREHRDSMKSCPSAKEGVEIYAIIEEFCGNDFYKEDYQAITSYFATDYVSYADVVENIRRIAREQCFDV